MSDPYDAPMKYITVIDSDKVNLIKQEFKLSNDEIVKLEIPKYNNENDELLLLTLREFNDMVTTYDLFTLLDAAKVYDRFLRCLCGDASDTWNSLISGSTKNKANFMTIEVFLSQICNVILLVCKNRTNQSWIAYNYHNFSEILQFDKHIW